MPAASVPAALMMLRRDNAPTGALLIVLPLRVHVMANRLFGLHRRADKMRRKLSWKRSLVQPPTVLEYNHGWFYPDCYVAALLNEGR